MDANRTSPGIVPVFFLLCLAACRSAPPPTVYLPPTPAQRPTQQVVPTGTFLPGIPTPVCVDNLRFISDLTIPDGTLVAPSTLIDKQWQVQNTGSCNWDVGYSLRFIGGTLMGAAAEQALYPARAGTRGVIRILFTAPSEAGEHYSLWQAHTPDAIPFGESFLIKIVVQP